MKEAYTDICKMIIKLKVKEAEYEAEYEAAGKVFSEQNQAVTYWEQRYSEYEAWKKQTDAYDRLEAVRDVLSHLRETAELIEEIEGM